MSKNEKSQEVDYKTKFCLKYFGKTGWRLDIDYVDVRLENRSGRPILYIDAKDKISCDGEDRRKAIAQAILTNKRQDLPLDKIGILYYDTKHERDMFTWQALLEEGNWPLPTQNLVEPRNVSALHPYFCGA